MDKHNFRFTTFDDTEIASSAFDSKFMKIKYFWASSAASSSVAPFNFNKNNKIQLCILLKTLKIVALQYVTSLTIPKNIR